MNNLPKRIIVSITAVLFALSIGEVGARIFFKRLLSEQLLTQKDIFGYQNPSGDIHNLPDRDVWTHGQNRDQIRITTDANGFRIPAGKPAASNPHDKKVVFLGDSITFGSGISEEDCFVARVRQVLGPKGIEVHNAAIQDVGLQDETILLRKTILPLNPNLVVLCWYLNDNRPPQGFPDEIVFDNPIVDWVNRHEWSHSSYLVRLAFKSATRYTVRHHVALMSKSNHRFDWFARFRKKEWKDNLVQFEVMQSQARNDWGDAWNADSMTAMEKKIMVMKRLTEKAGAQFVLVAFPVSPQVDTNVDDPFISRPQTEISRFCGENKIPFLDLLPVLRAKKELPLFFDQCHLTPKEGNPIVADALVEFLSLLSF